MFLHSLQYNGGLYAKTAPLDLCLTYLLKFFSLLVSTIVEQKKKEKSSTSCKKDSHY